MQIFEADWTDTTDWLLGPGWKVGIGSEMLICDGSVKTRSDAKLLRDINLTTDYAVEADVASLGGGNFAQFGLFVRRGESGGYWAGHDEFAAMIGEVWFIAPDDDEFDPASLRWHGTATYPIATSLFESETTAFEDLLDNEFHMFRLEVRGTAIRLHRDGDVLVAAHDARFRAPGSVGLYSAEFHQIAVRGFRVIALP